MNYLANSFETNLSLFIKFPTLKEKIPHIPLGSFPTPIERLHKLSDLINHKKIFIKRDDLSGKIKDGKQLYGGNKIRKLEFILADALKRGCSTVLTFGGAGSNHALATAVYSKKLGLKSILMLRNQPNSNLVKSNLLLDHYYDASMYYFPDNLTRAKAAEKILKFDTNNSIYVIPTGGSMPIGVIGFVNAVFELKEQILRGEIEEPDFIYLSLGSCGTLAGLLLGLELLKMKCKIIAATVEPEENPNKFFNDTKNLFKETNEFLNSIDSNFPIFEFPKNRFIFEKSFAGREYGLFTKLDYITIDLLKTHEKIVLDGTYSAKAMSALIENVSNGTIKPDETILFWHTYCGIDYADITDKVDYKQLPEEFYKYYNMK